MSHEFSRVLHFQKKNHKSHIKGSKRFLSSKNFKNLFSDYKDWWNDNIAPTLIIKKGNNDEMR